MPSGLPWQPTTPSSSSAESGGFRLSGDGVPTSGIMTPMSSLHGGVLRKTETTGTTPTLSEAQLGHRTLRIAFNRAMTHWGSGGALLETGGAVLSAGGTWIPVVANGAFRSDDSLSGTALVAAADTFFAGLFAGLHRQGPRQWRGQGVSVSRARRLVWRCSATRCPR